ncbi:MAG: MarC family protein [Ignavibacteriales bacterium]|nr:MarC family protein [Ignavibacteriales bacterium]
MSLDLNSLLLSIIPLFVAIDVLGVVPIYISLTEGLHESRKRTLVTEATLTALGLSIVFLLFGRLIFTFLGITEHDFRVGGGIVLLVLAVTDLLFAAPQKRRDPETSVGVVPIGIPLIMGPAALTTILILVDSFGYAVTILSLLANLMFVWIVFRYSGIVIKILGNAGSRAIAKVASLFMAAIAIMMIRVGITGMMN